MSGEPERYPIGLSLFQAMRWYWKARIWAVTFSLSRDETTPVRSHTYSGINFVQPTMGAILGGTTPSREDYGACYLGVNATQSVDSSPAAAGQLSWQMFTSENIAVGYNALNDLWFPRLYFVLNSGFGGANELSTIPTADPTATLFVDGQALTLYKDSSLSDVTWSGSVTISIAEFWPFKNKAGLDPVFDTVTGAEIADPFSRLP